MAIANINNAAPATSYSPAPASTNYAAMAMVTTLFFFWGFVTVLNDILIPHLKHIFDLNYTKASLIQFAFFSAYFIFSIPSAKIVDAIGYKKTMVTGLVTMGIGALTFIPAAQLASYPLFLGALMILAAGITALQVAANPYVAVLGPPQTASSRLNLTQAFNSLGTTVGPYIGGMMILNSAATSDSSTLTGAAAQAFRIQEASSVIKPYLILGIALMLFAVMIGLFKLPPIPGARHEAGTVKESVWKYRQLVLGAIGIFVYVGAEVSIGSYLINYFHLPEIGGLPEVAAAKYVSYYWGGAMVGRFIGSAVLQKVKTGTALAFAAIASCVLVCISMVTTGDVAMWTILAVGLFNSIMFPSIFTLGIAELGPLTGDGSGLLVMAIVGGALLPVATAALADRIGIHHSFIIPAVCYLYILYYALSGSRPTPFAAGQRAAAS